MINHLRKVLACGATAAALIGACSVPAQAAPVAKGLEAGGFWGYSCEYGRACLEANSNPITYWNIDGCGFHNAYMLAWAGKAHGNAFRVTYVNGLWDDVAAWSSRRLDVRNETRSVFVAC